MDPPSAVQWVCRSGIPHRAAGAGGPQWDAGMGAKRKEVAFSWTARAPLPLYVSGRWWEGDRKPPHSARGSRQRRDSRYNCSGALLQEAEKTPLHSWKSLCSPSPGLLQSLCKVLPLIPASQSSCPTLQWLPIRKPQLAAHQLQPQLLNPHGPCPVSGQPHGLLRKTLSFLPHQKWPHGTSWEEATVELLRFLCHHRDGLQR